MDLTYEVIRRLPLPRSVKNFLLVPPGHYYSPIPSLREVKKHEQAIFGPPPAQLPAIDLNTAGQLQLFDQLKTYYPSMPFKDRKTEGLRYYFENEIYSYSDAIILHTMIRHVKPRHIIEIGSGFSSCVTLDTNELFFKNAIHCTFIEPFPSRLRSLIKAGDESTIELLESTLQDIDISTFDQLMAGDFLFVDSTHVGKIHSDVNRLFFEIFPRLARGVYIHIHDIMYPFDYPREWIYQGKAWNEAYMLRSFLEYNSAFKIVFFNTYLEQFYEERFRIDMPLCLKNRGGSIWLRKE